MKLYEKQKQRNMGVIQLFKKRKKHVSAFLHMILPEE